MCNISLEQFEDMSLAWFQVEAKAVAQRVQVTTVWRQPISKLLFPAELSPKATTAGPTPSAKSIEVTE